MEEKSSCSQLVTVCYQIGFTVQCISAVCCAVTTPYMVGTCIINCGWISSQGFISKTMLSYMSHRSLKPLSQITSQLILIRQGSRRIFVHLMVAPYKGKFKYVCFYYRIGIQIKSSIAAKDVYNIGNKFKEDKIVTKKEQLLQKAIT